MGEGLRQQANEWFEKGRRDLETAQLLYDERGYTDIIAYHIQQAIEKYLKGYLVLHGKRPPKIHELDGLLNVISRFDDSLSEFIDLCEKATRYYIESRYPPGPTSEYEYQEIREDLDSAWSLARTIEEKLS